MSKFTTLLALFVFLSAFTQNQAPSEVQLLTENFNTAMMSCPQKIWSNYKWDGLKIVLMYPSKNDSWIWDATTNKTQTISNTELPTSAIGSMYEFFELNGHKVMSLNMGEDISDVFKLGVHEFFHHIGQENWTINQTGGRGTLYPLDGVPRFYRRMIYDNLKQYFQTGNQISLGHAKYWFNKWTLEFSNETQATTDGYEGTAKYVEIMAAAVIKLGCSATNEKIKAEIINIVTSDFGFSVSGQHLALDSEGYEIGGLAAFILKFSEFKLSDWNSRISAGETPLQVLLEPVVPIVEPPPAGLMDQFEQAAQKVNEERGPILDNDISNWNNKSYIRVPAPYSWLQSNLMPQFFAHSSELDLDLYPLATDHQYISPRLDGSNYQIKTNGVLFSYYTTACSSDQYSFTLVPEELFVHEGRSANLTSGSVLGHLVGEIKTDEQGYKYFCTE